MNYNKLALEKLLNETWMLKICKLSQLVTNLEIEKMVILNDYSYDIHLNQLQISINQFEQIQFNYPTS